MTITSYAGVYIGYGSFDPKVSLEQAKEMAKQQVGERRPVMDTTCPHGARLYIESPDDLPDESTPSPCGQANCWLVEYHIIKEKGSE